MTLSRAQRILESNKPFVFYHAHEVLEFILSRAIVEEKSMDLDVCIDADGDPYLGHSMEYFDKALEPMDKSMPIWEVVQLIANSNIPVMVDCKHYDAWNFVEQVIERIGSARCLVHALVSEFDFHYIDASDYRVQCEFSPAEVFSQLKRKFSEITAIAIGLPNDHLVSKKYEEILWYIKKAMKHNLLDTVCLNVPDNTFAAESLTLFLKVSLIPHVMIDKKISSRFSEVYIGETDCLEKDTISPSYFGISACGEGYTCYHRNDKHFLSNKQVLQGK